MSTNSTGPANNETNPGAVPGFTADQVQCILSLIEMPRDGYEKLSSKGEWLFDTGASCHMTRTHEYLENVKNIFPMIFGLLDSN